MADWMTSEQRSRNMSAIRSKGTSPERRLREVLRDELPRRKVVEHPPLPGTPDYYLPGLRTAIFVDGCFFHLCPKHGHVPEDNAEYWGPKLAGNRARDRRASRALRASGIRVVRVWEHELRAQPTNRLRARIRRLADAASRPPCGGSRGPAPLGATAPIS